MRHCCTYYLLLLKLGRAGLLVWRFFRGFSNCPQREVLVWLLLFLIRMFWVAFWTLHVPRKRVLEEVVIVVAYWIPVSLFVVIFTPLPRGGHHKRMKE